MATSKVKICGLTRPEDAELAVELGAWALGFILWPGSARAADPAIVAGVSRLLRRRAHIVGVFVNPTLDEVADAVDTLGLWGVQLHGDEGPSFCSAVVQRTGAKVIKGLRIGATPDLVDADRYHVDFHLLDSAVRGLRGGSGTAWDWTLATRRRSKVPRILSGGLDAGNVAEGIETVKPYAVDVASGVESSPGVKDPDRLRAFFEAVAPPVPEPAPEPANVASAAEEAAE